MQNYLEGLDQEQRDEVINLIQAEIDWYLNAFKEYEADKDRDVRPGLKSRNPLRIEELLRLIEEDVWNALPAWQQIVFSEVIPQSPAGKCILKICMDDDADTPKRYSRTGENIIYASEATANNFDDWSN